mgnify:CR=1 FL=1
MSFIVSKLLGVRGTGSAEVSVVRGWVVSGLEFTMYIHSYKSALSPELSSLQLFYSMSTPRISFLTVLIMRSQLPPI